ncbi:hypothetical protein ColTof3_11885 [Colletotrichum tofieldiae]|nr:hypothetical protein ColTof3_11885 [Colletotrichum tofieldiae]
MQEYHGGFWVTFDQGIADEGPSLWEVGQACNLQCRRDGQQTKVHVQPRDDRSPYTAYRHRGVEAARTKPTWPQEAVEVRRAVPHIGMVMGRWVSEWTESKDWSRQEDVPTIVKVANLPGHVLDSQTIAAEQLLGRGARKCTLLSAQLADENDGEVQLLET